MKRFAYTIYGLGIDSRIDLGLPPSSVSASTVSIDYGQQRLHSPFTDSFCSPLGDSLFFQFEEDVAFLVRPDDQGISIQVHPPSDDDGWKRTRMYLIGPVLAYVLELQKTTALHASCLLVDSGALAFLSSSGGGKSNLAATAICCGAPLIADDITAVDNGMHVQLGPPRLKLWPGDIPPSWGSPDSFELVHPAHDKRLVSLRDGGRVAESGAPLRCLYLPSRSPTITECRFEPVGPAAAIVELVRHSFAPQLVEIIGIQAERLQRLAKIVEQVPVRRMTYPDGKQHLEAVWRAVQTDLHELCR